GEARGGSRRPVGLVRVALLVGCAAGRARAPLPRPRRGRQRPAASARVEPRRLREQLGAAGCRYCERLRGRGLTRSGGPMARTALFGKLQDAVSSSAEAAARGGPVGEGVDEHRTTGGGVLKEGGAVGGGRAGAGATAFGRLAPLARAAGNPRIAVVGAGLAGLTCAYRLKQAGLTAQVYEASSRVGGRCWTIRGAFADGQIAEHGG